MKFPWYAVVVVMLGCNVNTPGKLSVFTYIIRKQRELGWVFHSCGFVLFFGWLFFCKGRKTLYAFLISLYFKNLSEGGQTNFVCFRATCIEMVTSLAHTPHGRQYLAQQGVIDKISNIIIGAESDPFSSFYLPGYIMHFLFPLVIACIH